MADQSPNYDGPVTTEANHPRVVALWSVGLLGGLLAGFLGVGGGILMVPLLMMWARFDQRRAQATSLLAIAPAAIIGATSYAVGGIFPLLPAIAVALGALVGAQIGAWLLRVLSLGWLRWLFITFVLAMSTTVMFLVPDRSTQLSLGLAEAVGLVAIGVVMGVTAGLFGVGGGIVAIPALMVFFGVGDLEAKGVSLLAMVPAALSGGLSHVWHKTATLRDGGWVALGSLVGAPIGSLGAFIIPATLANLVFGGFGLAIAGVLIVRAVRSPR